MYSALSLIHVEECGCIRNKLSISQSLPNHQLVFHTSTFFPQNQSGFFPNYKERVRLHITPPLFPPTSMEENEPQPHLSFPVDSNDATSGLMRGGDKDGVTTDAVHVDAGASLNVVQMDVSVLGDQEHHTMLLACLRTQIRTKLGLKL